MISLLVVSDMKKEQKIPKESEEYCVGVMFNKNDNFTFSEMLLPTLLKCEIPLCNGSKTCLR